MDQDFNFGVAYKTEFNVNTADQDETSVFQTMCTDDQLIFDPADKETAFKDKLVADWKAKRKAFAYYDKHVRKRRPQEAWKVGRPWLKFVDNIMFCEYCSEDGVFCSFTEGCKAGRLTSVKIHEHSEIHRIAAAKRTHIDSEAPL